MKRIFSILAAFAAVIGISIMGTLPANAAGNCTTYGAGSCKQHVTVNTVSQHTITLSYGAGTPPYYVPRATSANFVCGNVGGIVRIYVHSGYNVRIKGWFGNNNYVTIYYTSTGYHTLPAAFRPPQCTYPYSGSRKYGWIDDIYEYKQ